MGKQPVTGQKKSKDAISKAANSKKGGKKKWGKGKAKDKLENKTFLSKQDFEAIEKGISKLRLISVSILHDRYKIIGSISRRLIKHFEAAGKIKKYAQGNANQYLYAGVDAGKEEVKAENTKGAKAPTGKQAKAAKAN